MARLHVAVILFTAFAVIYSLAFYSARHELGHWMDSLQEEERTDPYVIRNFLLRTIGEFRRLAHSFSNALDAISLFPLAPGSKEEMAQFTDSCVDALLQRGSNVSVDAMSETDVAARILVAYLGHSCRDAENVSECMESRDLIGKEISAGVPCGCPISVAHVQSRARNKSSALSAQTNQTNSTEPPTSFIRRLLASGPGPKLRIGGMDIMYSWLIALGFIVLILGCCVLYSLRQITVLRETVDELQTTLTDSKEELDRSMKEQKEILEKRPADGMAAHVASTETAQLLIKMKTVEKELEGQESRLTDFIHRTTAVERSLATQKERAASAALESQTKEDSVVDFGLSVISRGSPQSPSGMLSVPSQQMDFTRSGSGLYSGSAMNGLSVNLPPRFWVYEHVPGEPYQHILKKRLHSISLGTHSDVGSAQSSNDVTFMFSSVEATKQPGGDQVAAQPYARYDGAPGVSVIAMASIMCVEIKRAAPDFAAQLSVVCGDERDVLCVTFFRHNTRSASRSAEPGSRETVEGSPLSRQRYLSRSSTQSAATQERPFVFYTTTSQAMEEWVAFMSQLIGDRLVLADGSVLPFHSL